MKAVDLEKYNLIVKLHPVDRAGFQGVEDSRVICDTKYLSYDWFWECDKIITDYSGVGVEAALANKPVYFYLYDYENYNVKNGLTVDLYEEPIAPYVTKSSGHLAELLKEDYDMSVLEAYRNKYVEVDTHNCSKALAQWLLNLEDELGAMQ